MSGPSDKAVAAASYAFIDGLRDRDKLDKPKAGRRTRARMRGVLEAAHAPTLGLDRSVWLRDVRDRAIDWIEKNLGDPAENAAARDLIDFIEHEFGGGS